MTKPTALPPRELLRKLLSYNLATGVLTWRERPRDTFASARAWKVWNARYAARPALNHICAGHGYRVGRINKRNYLAHRIIWKMLTGKEPPQIDHLNGDRADNRFLNLRDADARENSRNRAVRRDNETGALGVYRTPKGRFAAKITADRTVRYLGTYDTIDEASAARAAAERDLGFASRRAIHTGEYL